MCDVRGHVSLKTATLIPGCGGKRDSLCSCVMKIIFNIFRKCYNLVYCNILLNSCPSHSIIYIYRIAL